MQDRVVIVTGASGNLGRAVVAELLSAGANVLATGHDGHGLAGLAAPESGRLETLGSIDLGDPAHCARVVAHCLATFGRVDGLANTVGGFDMGPVAPEGLALFDRLMEMNARTAYAISAAVLPAMQEAGHGRIVHVAAAPGLKAGARQSAYAASKAAVIRLTEAIAAENRDRRITANCILPGTIDTPDNRRAMPDADRSAWVSAQAIARLIRFLLSAEASAVTGAAIPATGRD
ncbi:SDR family NAD(P)-dependent oxidoreductase [Ensifer soli]|uniref:SDR family NAD(P)-dependent oxidoreductase n=1 Tax=Ciceribacter sp. sgz301302 TaxID=3342379 RepID=UPI0035BB1DD7